MASHTVIDQHNARYASARALLERRGIQPEDGDYTSRQLARELARRGWRWELLADEVRVTKAFGAEGTAPQAFIAEGGDRPTALALVLAEAIKYDDEHGTSSAGPYRADVVVRAAHGDIVAIVEVKNSLHLTASTAEKLRRDLMADARLGDTIPYFLVLSQDVGFFWDRESDPSPTAAPTRQFPMDSVVAHYVDRRRRNDRLTGRELEPIVSLWLGDLANVYPDRPIEADAFFAGTGFLESLRGTSVDTDVIV